MAKDVGAKHLAEDRGGRLGIVSGGDGEGVIRGLVGYQVGADGSLVQDGAGAGELEARPGEDGQQALCEDGGEKAGPVEAGPAAEAGVEDEGVEAGDLVGVGFGGGRVGDVACDEGGGAGVDGGQVAEIELDGEQVDAGGGVVGVVVRAGAGAEGGGGGGRLGEVLLQVEDCLAGLADGAGRRDEDQVGGEGAGREEVVDQAFADSEANTTGGGVMSVAMQSGGQKGACHTCLRR